MTDEEIGNLRRGGHDPKKVYNAYKAAVDYKGGPTVVLARPSRATVLGDAGEGRNFTHGQKELNEKAMEYFRGRFEIPVSDEAAREGAFYKPPDGSPEMAYMHERRRVLGGYMPARKVGPAQFAGAGPGLLQRHAGGLARARSVHHHGVRQAADQADEASANRPAHCPDRAR